MFKKFAEGCNLTQSSMCVFHVFKILQMIANRAKRHIYAHLLLVMTLLLTLARSYSGIILIKRFFRSIRTGDRLTTVSCSTYITKNQSSQYGRGSKDFHR